MANLFFIHTPMQLFMAQQIINQEGLKDNVMVYDYAGANAYYQKTYDMICIPVMWKRRILNPVRLGWNMTREKRHFLKSIRDIRHKVKLLEKFVRNENAKALYLGDMLNGGYRILAHLFYPKGLTIGFFEEGFSHYTGRVAGKPKLPEIVKTILIDVFVYLPLYQGCYEYKAKIVDNDVNKIPQTVRYSLIPYYNEPFDRIVKSELLLSPILHEYLEKEKIEILKIKQDGELILFVNEDICHFAAGINNSIEEELLKESVFLKSKKESVFLIKFHPAESDERRKMVAKFFEDNNIKFFILSKGMNVPVEYYLQMYKFSRIFTYATAVSLYNGYLFPYTNTTRLLDDLLFICRRRGIDHTDRLAKIILRLDGIQETLKRGIGNYVR